METLTKTEKLIKEFETLLFTKNPKIQKVVHKTYIAYKTDQNIACLVPNHKKHSLKIYLKTPYTDIQEPSPNIRCVKNIGHHGTGDTEVKVRKVEDLNVIGGIKGMV